MRNWIRALVLALLVAGPVWAVAQREAVAPVDPAKARSAPPPESRIDINRATVDELMTVPGMTRGWALRIVRYRPYRTKFDLYLEGVVTSEYYERIRYNIIAHRMTGNEIAEQPAATKELAAARTGGRPQAGR